MGSKYRDRIVDGVYRDSFILKGVSRSGKAQTTDGEDHSIAIEAPVQPEGFACSEADYDKYLLGFDLGVRADAVSDSNFALKPPKKTEEEKVAGRADRKAEGARKRGDVVQRMRDEGKSAADIRDILDGLGVSDTAITAAIASADHVATVDDDEGGEDE